MRISPALAAIFLSTGCANNIHAQFEEAKTYALQTAAPPANNWGAEVAVWLSDDLVEEIILKAVNDQLSERKSLTVSVATLYPTATLKSVDIKASKECSDCLKVKLVAKGETDWEVSRLKGTVPFDLTTTATVKLTSGKAGDVYQVKADITELSKLEATLGKSDGLSIDLPGSITDWARERIVEEVPTISLVELGGDDLPARELRVVAEEDALRVELLTDAAHGAPLVLSSAAVPADGWQVSVSEDTLLDLARRAAFQHGEVTEDIWAEPTSLQVSRDGFTLGLRIWKLSGMGWWRDYEVTGTLALEGEKLALKPEAATERESSAGAGLVDPLALLAQGIILDAIVDAAAQSFPLPDSQSIGTRTLHVSVDTIRGRSGEVTVAGQASLSENGRERTGGDSKSGNEKSGNEKSGKGGRNAKGGKRR